MSDPTDLPADMTWGDFAAQLEDLASGSHLTDRDRRGLLAMRDQALAMGPLVLASRFSFADVDATAHVERALAAVLARVDISDDHRAGIARDVLDEYARTRRIPE